MGEMKMGYILPLTNYQYMQYAERETGIAYEPFHIGKVSRIRKEDPVQKGQDEQQVAPMRQRQDQQPVARMQKAVADFSPPRSERIYKKRVNPVLVSETYAELTGKGKHYSESI